jgi:hypothetical protein
MVKPPTPWPLLLLLLSEQACIRTTQDVHPAQLAAPAHLDQDCLYGFALLADF